MTGYKKVSFVLSIWWLDVKSLPGKIKRSIWNKHILLRWNRLWIRKDELHRSLDVDIEAMREMNKQERKKYIADIVRRRKVAHQKDLSKC